jgi:hypothetical protein
LMSACIPAPALESLPAIDSAIFIDFEWKFIAGLISVS